ncbi:MAG: hypothetical protein GWP67_03760 [Gammaproteobacteria bacterium]|jgi:uncharacterized metal-binding protein YceD (DUF177 family)|nr:hypothetical protein [Gammaproteobacteria bacterium]
MSNPLRDRRSVTDLAAAGQVIEIAEKISSFEGLASILEADLAALDSDKLPSAWRESVVSGALQFGFADAAGRVPKLTGSAEVNVAAVCQRCLQAFELMIRVAPELLLLDAQDDAQGYEDIEVWELDERTVRPQDIVEELLIMAMPFSAMHDNMAECKALLSDDSSTDESVEKPVKPFAALRLQMTQNEKDPDT